MNSYIFLHNLKKWNVNSIIQLLLWYLFLANIADALFIPVFAIFVTGWIAGATFSTVGFAIAVASIAKSLFQLPLARMLDKRAGERDDFWVLLLGAVIVTVGAFGLLVIRRALELYILNALLGVGSAMLMAAYYAIFAHHADKGAEGFEWSLFSVGGLTISTAIGAALGGVVADWYGLRALIVIVGLLNAFSTVLILVLYPFLIHPPAEK